eukprot:791020-Lingulodinium_polyedra.AAC.1
MPGIAWRQPGHKRTVSSGSQASLRDRESRTACARSETVTGSTGVLLSPPTTVEAPIRDNRLSATRTHF